jgi:hypothetical protein
MVAIVLVDLPFIAIRRNIPVPINRRLLSDFGYSASDLPEGGKIIET